MASAYQKRNLPQWLFYELIQGVELSLGPLILGIATGPYLPEPGPRLGNVMNAAGYLMNIFIMTLIQRALKVNTIDQTATFLDGVFRTLDKPFWKNLLERGMDKSALEEEQFPEIKNPAQDIQDGFQMAACVTPKVFAQKFGMRQYIVNGLFRHGEVRADLSKLLRVLALSAAVTSILFASADLTENDWANFAITSFCAYAVFRLMQAVPGMNAPWGGQCCQSFLRGDYSFWSNGIQMGAHQRLALSDGENGGSHSNALVPKYSSNDIV